MLLACCLLAAKPVVAQDVDRKMIAKANGIVEVAFTLPAPFFAGRDVDPSRAEQHVDFKRSRLST